MLYIVDTGSVMPGSSADLAFLQRSPFKQAPIQVILWNTKKFYNEKIIYSTDNDTRLYCQ